MESSYEEFLSYLFLLMADGEPYDTVKKYLANEHLNRGDGVYPTELPGMKRFMANFSAPATKTTVQAEPAQAGGLAFVKTDNPRITGQCYYCRKPGHMAKFCKTATPAQITVAYKVADDAFKKKNGGGGDKKSTSGVINAAVQDEDASKISDSSGSKPSYAELLQFQQLIKRMLYVNVGEEFEAAPGYDKIEQYGFGYAEVGTPQPRGVPFAEPATQNDEQAWTIQGRRWSKPTSDD